MLPVVGILAVAMTWCFLALVFVGCGSYLALVTLYTTQDLELSRTFKACLLPDTNNNSHTEFELMDKNLTSNQTSITQDQDIPLDLPFYRLIAILLFVLNMVAMALDLLTYKEMKSLVVPEMEVIVKKLEECMKIPLRATLITTSHNIILAILFAIYLKTTEASLTNNR